VKRIALILATLTLVGSLSRGGLVGYAATETAPDKFVRTANYYLLSGSALDSAEARRVLPKFDILVLPVEAQVFNRDFFAHARRVNPDIIILAYVVSTSGWLWEPHLELARAHPVKPQHPMDGLSCAVHVR